MVVADNRSAQSIGKLSRVNKFAEFQVVQRSQSNHKKKITATAGKEQGLQLQEQWAPAAAAVVT